MKAKWIWYPADFELYHSMLCHTGRQSGEARVPAFWRVPRPELACSFERRVTLAEPRPLRVVTHGAGRVLLNDQRFGAVNEELLVPAGEQRITVNVFNRESFPSIFIESPGFETGEGWQVHCYDKKWCEPESEPAFYGAEDDPAVFPFAYEKLVPVSVEEIGGGWLYDFGTEKFGPVTVSQKAEMGAIRLSYGESREEALEWDEAIIRDRLPARSAEIRLESRAFRCLYVTAEQGCPAISAENEYLPLEDAASFSCDRPLIDSVWEICTRTVHLDARQFYLDGLKQDGWVWAGDAYQAYMAGRYLFDDQAVTRRSIRALFGKLPVCQHINTINDYSCYQILSVWEYYFASGDLGFIRKVWPETKALYEFTVSRLEEETGYMIGREGDWIFIDWSFIDKTDPNSTEQILLWQVHRVMGLLAEALGEPMPETAVRAEALKANILRDFWDEEQGAFICTPATGERLVTRHANIMAVLSGFADEAMRERIRRVLLSESVPPITTPFFKFFELLALSKLGEIEETQRFIESYWGKMVELGATTVWEQFDPRRTGPERYSMYGQKYGCSLCHVWGSGPIVLLGQYVAGVAPTAVGGQRFTVAPQPGLYEAFEATVPVASGRVSVSYRDGVMSAQANVPGGTFVFAGEEIAMEPGKKYMISRKKER